MEALRRAIVSPEKYERYIPLAPCKPTYLGFDNTFLSINIIRDKAYKSASQAKELSMVLRANNLKQLTDNIYLFAYQNFQYKSDGAEQKILTLACAWKYRTQGIDCKTYSVVVSSILLASGIVHFIRKVEQPAVQPGTYTHVYVIVPKNQQNPKAITPSDYYVIDATTHDNKEVRFTKNYDIVMTPKFHHVGLSMPNLAEDNEMIESIAKFKQLLKDFRDAGASESNLQNIWEELKNVILNNKEVFIGFVGKNLLIGNKIFPIDTKKSIPFFAKNNNDAIGLGILPVVVASAPIVAKAIPILTKVTAISGIANNLFNGVKNFFGSIFGGKSKDNLDEEAAFNLSIPFFIEKSGIQTELTDETITQFSRWMNFYIANRQWYIDNRTGATKQSNINIQKAVIEFRDKTILDTKNQLSNENIGLIIKTTVSDHIVLPDGIPGHKGVEEATFTYPSYQMVNKTTNTPIQNLSKQNSSTQTQNAGFGTAGIILALLAGGFAIKKFMPKSK